MSNIAKDSSKKKKKSTFGFGKIKVFSDFDETSGNDSLCKMSYRDKKGEKLEPVNSHRTKEALTEGQQEGQSFSEKYV